MKLACLTIFILMPFHIGARVCPIQNDLANWKQLPTQGDEISEEQVNFFKVILNISEIQSVQKMGSNGHEQQLINAIKSWARGKGIDTNNSKKLNNEIFKYADKNGNNSLDNNEIKIFLSTIGIGNIVTRDAWASGLKEKVSNGKNISKGKLGGFIKKANR